MALRSLFTPSCLVANGISSIGAIVLASAGCASGSVRVATASPHPAIAAATSDEKQDGLPTNANGVARKVMEAGARVSVTWDPGSVVTIKVRPGMSLDNRDADRQTPQTDR